METTIIVAGRRHEVRMEQTDNGWQADVDGQVFRIKVDRRGTQAAVDAGGHVHIVDLLDASTAVIDGTPLQFRIDALKGVAGAQDSHVSRHGPVKPPMTGRLDQIIVKQGDVVRRGDVLFILEAMKMRNEVKSPDDGIIGSIHAKAGDAVEPGTAVLELLPP